MKDKMILDRHGNRIRIIIKDEKNTEKYLNYYVFEDMTKHIQLNPEIYIKYIWYLLDSNLFLNFNNLTKGEHIRKIILKNLLKFNSLPNEILILENKKRKYKFKYDFNLNLIKEIILNDQYNLRDLKIKNPIIFDIGANVGVFSIYAAMLGAKKVYAFEPVPGTYEMLKENIILNNLMNKVVPINKGVSNFNDKKYIGYSSNGDCGASFRDSKIKKRTEIDMITIDKFIKRNKIEKIDFIKIDVEGYEENVLLGAKETIKKWKPILSFSAYHLPTDKERLPKIVKSIRPDYTIELNKFGEEVFYCY